MPLHYCSRHATAWHHHRDLARHYKRITFLTTRLQTGQVGPETCKRVICFIWEGFLCSLTNCLSHAVTLKVQVQQHMVWLMTFLALLVSSTCILGRKMTRLQAVVAKLMFPDKIHELLRWQRFKFLHTYKGCLPTPHDMQAVSTFAIYRQLDL